MKIRKCLRSQEAVCVMQRRFLCRSSCGGGQEAHAVPLNGLRPRWHVLQSEEEGDGTEEATSEKGAQHKKAHAKEEAARQKEAEKLAKLEEKQNEYHKLLRWGNTYMVKAKNGDEMIPWLMKNPPKEGEAEDKTHKRLKDAFDRACAGDVRVQKLQKDLEKKDSVIQNLNDRVGKLKARQNELNDDNDKLMEKLRDSKKPLKELKVERDRLSA